jgi:PIN domain nuclease of toxin-antitoxin system
VVLDTSALLALLFKEAGADVTLARGANGVVSAVSYSETMAKSLDKGVPLETAEHVLRGLELSMVPFDGPHAVTAATFRPITRHLDISFADRACLATAALASLPVLTGDRDWQKCDLGVNIILIR